ncbi:DUF4190 domain-containing protein [Gordonia aurantiaca]|uniref:DUF4190 domain-containing protein n=1 Tax=Gordonia sp. B21 TaxID=3151852 RepID=UPI0032671537
MSSFLRRGFVTAADLHAVPETSSQLVHRRTNLCAIISLFSGLTLIAVPAVVFGAIGIAEVLRRDHEDGASIAAFGLVLGVLEIAALVVLYVLTDWRITDPW